MTVNTSWSYLDVPHSPSGLVWDVFTVIPHPRLVFLYYCMDIDSWYSGVYCMGQSCQIGIIQYSLEMHEKYNL